jgi:CHRD domain
MRMRQITIGALTVLGLVFGLTALAGAQGAGNRALFAVLTGAKEVDANGDRGAGDRNGRGSFSATLDGRELCWGIQVKNIDDPVDAHIHRGGPNVAGPVVVPLERPDGGDPGTSMGCERLTASLARQIRSTPRRFYVNVHTPDLPNGAVRGQLFSRAR